MLVKRLMKVPREAGGRKVAEALAEVMTEGAFIDGALLGISGNRHIVGLPAADVGATPLPPEGLVWPCAHPPSLAAITDPSLNTAVMFSSCAVM